MSHLKRHAFSNAHRQLFTFPRSASLSPLSPNLQALQPRRHAYTDNRKAAAGTKALLKSIRKSAVKTSYPSTKARPSQQVPFQDANNTAQEEGGSTDEQHAGSNISSNQNSTMTNRERNAFQRLFNSMSSSGRTLDSGSQPSEIDHKVPDTTALFAPRSLTLDAYPQELRAMAARVQRQMNERRDASAFDEITKTDQANLEPEIQKIEKLMYSARTDAEIWKILDEHVFTPLKQLDAEIRYRSANTNPSSNTTTTTTKSNPNIIAMSCSLLFTSAMRLLSRRTVYTQYADALLPTIKTHSWTTSILGISTGLYNEVLFQSWHSRQDLISMSDRLQEMDRAGLEFDHETLDILNDVTVWIRRAQRGDFGRAVKATEGLIERQKQVAEIGRWKSEVRMRLESKAVQETERAEAERRLGLEAEFQ